MSEERRKPAIRFAGFSEEWERRKVGDLASDIYGGGTPSTSRLDFWNGSIPWIQSSDLTEHQVFGVVPKKYISKTAVKNSATKIIPENSLAVITRVGVGKLAVMPYSYATSQDFLSLSKLNADIQFSAYLLYKKLQSELSSVQGTSIKGITKEELLAKTVALPERQEQEAVGIFFRNLDTLITLHQRKYDKLLCIKKAMLEKMFPKNGSCFPEIRFAGFTAAWEPRQWSDTVDISTEMVDPRTGIYDGLPHVAPGNIESFTGHLYDNVKLVKDENLISGKFHFYDGDILYGKINPQLGKYLFARFEGLTSADAYVLNAKNGLAQEYLYSILQTRDFFNYSVSVSMRSGMPKINRDELNAYFFFAPSEEEQRRIGHLFINLDHLITHQQQTLEKLKTLKKAFLEKMFV